MVDEITGSQTFDPDACLLDALTALEAAVDATPTGGLTWQQGGATSFQQHVSNLQHANAEDGVRGLLGAFMVLELVDPTGEPAEKLLACRNALATSVQHLLNRVQGTPLASDVRRVSELLGNPTALTPATSGKVDRERGPLAWQLKEKASKRKQ